MWPLILFFPCLPVAYTHSDYKGCSNLFAFLTFLLKLKISVVFLMENGCVFAPAFRLWWNLHPYPSSEVHGSPEPWACNKSLDKSDPLWIQFLYPALSLTGTWESGLDQTPTLTPAVLVSQV